MAEPSSSAPVHAKPAATVILMRDAQEGVEIYLVQRPVSMGFMGGMHVLPGGKVCAGDTTAQMHARIDDADHASLQVWGEGIEQSEALQRAVAAIRETFEEAGVLLSPNAKSATLAPLRKRLLDGDDFAALLGEAQLTLQLASLVPLVRWITPESEPVRFDTSFYVARAPAGQEAEHDKRESTAGCWLSPAQAVAAAREKRIRLAPPTAHTLEGLLAVDSVDAALALAGSRPPPVVLPILRVLGREVVVLYPGDPEHPDKVPIIDGPTRRVLRTLAG